MVGVVIETRDSKGFVTVTLGDLEPQGRFPTRLAVSLDPRTAKRVLPEALTPQAQVQVDGTVDVWVNRAQIQLRGQSLVRVGSAGTQAAYDAAVRAIGEERLGEVVPPLPLFLRRLLLLAPIGTTLGDLTRDLGGWQPPQIVHRPLPGDSPDLGRLITSAVRAAHEDGEGPFDMVAVMRGGAIEPISGWDDVELLRTVDALQRKGLPVLVAVGHADHAPLVYRVAGYGVRHTAEAGRWLADHNLGAATRIGWRSALCPGCCSSGSLRRPNGSAGRASRSMPRCMRISCAAVRRWVVRPRGSRSRCAGDSSSRGGGSRAPPRTSTRSPVGWRSSPDRMAARRCSSPARP